MALSVDWISRIITVPQADLAAVSAGVFELDIDAFRLELKALEQGPGIAFATTHEHNTTVTFSGVTAARTVVLINGYTVTFEDGQYAVNLVGANSNIADVTNVNQVSVRPQNSLGLVQVASGSGLSAEQSDRLSRIERILANRMITDPASGILTVYADDDVTPLETAEVYEDASGAQPYRGQGIERRERLR